SERASGSPIDPSDSDASTCARALHNERGQTPVSVLIVPTSEGVDLRHEIAGAGSRFAAGLLDGLILLAGYLALFLAVLLPMQFDPTRVSGFVVGLLAGGWMLGVIGYHVGFHSLSGGQTPGKRALGIRVLSADGLPPRTMQLVLRALIWPVD